MFVKFQLAIAESSITDIQYYTNKTKKKKRIQQIRKSKTNQSKLVENNLINHENFHKCV